MEQLPSSTTAVESRVQVDGKVVTSRGPGTTMEYSVALVEQLYGKEKADEVSGPLVFFFTCIQLLSRLLLGKSNCVIILVEKSVIRVE